MRVWGGEDKNGDFYAPTKNNFRFLLNAVFPLLFYNTKHIFFSKFNDFAPSTIPPRIRYRTTRNRVRLIRSRGLQRRRREPNRNSRARARGID